MCAEKNLGGKKYSGLQGCAWWKLAITPVWQYIYVRRISLLVAKDGNLRLLLAETAHPQLLSRGR